MIGTLENATKALDLVRKGLQYNLPIGWDIIGEGSARIALLGPDSVVYKVEYDGFCYEGEESQMESEYRAWEKFGDIPFVGIRLAECHKFVIENTPVNAMEYVIGTTPGFKDMKDIRHRTYEIEAATGICDLHRHNLLIDSNDDIVIIDYGL